jgi:hypothetical protein
MKILELIIDFLKAYAWPIFFTTTLLIFKKQVVNIGSFLGNIIAERGIGIQHKDTSLRIDPPGTQEKDVSLSAETIPHKEIEQGVSGDIKFGFLETKGISEEVTDEVEITRDLDQMTFENKTYETGQRVYFAVVNDTSDNLVLPLCHIEFPAAFKHLNTENPATGVLTINSELWGLSGRFTELKEVSLSRTEISGILARVLKPGEFVRFFVRFNIPKNEFKFDLQMKLKAVDEQERKKDLTIKVKV